MIDYSKYYFAAFVITKDRPDILVSTVNKLLNQSFPPCFILVIDNGSEDITSDMIKQLNDKRISHYSVGYNAGPAGGAYWGMKLLFEKDYDWVLWVDDDDPPKFDDLFEEIRKVSLTVEGIVDTEKCYIRKVGMKYHVDLHAAVDATISVKKGHDIAHKLVDVLKDNIPQLGHVLIHIEPND